MKIDYYVYHIGLKGMSVDEGYVGVSKDPYKRFNQHAKSKMYVGKAIRKYGSRVKMTILKQTSLKYALFTESQLRPSDNIGWNLAAGGGMPPNHKGRVSPRRGEKLPEATRMKMSRSRIGKKNPKYGTGKEVVAVIGSVKLTFRTAKDAADNLALQQSDIRKVCRGERLHSGGIWFYYKE